MESASKQLKMHKEVVDSMFLPDRTPNAYISAISNSIPNTIPGITTAKILPLIPGTTANNIHCHDCYELLWISPGFAPADHIIDRKQTCIRPGEMMLIPFNRRHRISIPSGLPVSGYKLDFTREFFKHAALAQDDALFFDWGHILQWLSKNDSDRLCLLFQPNEAERVDALFSKVHEASEKLKGVSKLRTSPLIKVYISEMIPPLKKLFAIIRDRVYSACTAEELEQTTKYRPHMLRVLDHIDEHLAEKITLEELCAVSGYKSAWFLEIFRGMLGLSPIEYINFSRCRLARSLLVNTDMPIGEIGRACGYTSQIYFNRVFKSYLGCTPKEYRREYVIEWQD